jgi:RNA polymerase sigma factor (sigma-70 family)
LYGHLRDRLLPQIRRFAANSISDPEEVLNDTFVVLWKNLPRLRIEIGLIAYGRTVAHRLVAKEWRRWCRTCPWHGQTRLVPALEDRNIELDRFLRAVESPLKVKERRLWTMLFVEGIDKHEIQKRLKVTPEVLSKRKSRLLSKVRRIAAGFTAKRRRELLEAGGGLQKQEPRLSDPRAVPAGQPEVAVVGAAELLFLKSAEERPHPRID